MILHQQLILLIGMSLLAREIFASASCFSKHQISMYYFCNLTEIPLVPSDTVKFLLSFNNIKQVNANSFPLLEQLLLLEIGSQFTDGVTIGKAAFENLPNLQVLDLGHNTHLYLDLDAFVGLPNLTVLRLFGNALGDYILQDNYFQDLISLEDLDLSSNRITSLRPHPSFYNLKSLKRVNLKYNWIQILCEGNLHSFQGKTSLIFSLNSNVLYRHSSSMNWAKCGNPLRNINLDTLDVGSNGWNVDTVRNFSTAVEGTSITFLKLSHHIMGMGFGFANIKEPDNSTFAGLARSGLRLLDISQGYIFSLNPCVFQNLTDLEWLNLYKNKINQIQKGAFFGLGKLNFLNLSYNLLGELYDFTFEGLHNVAIIDLQQNHIGAIRENSFKDLLRLKMVNLRDNAIKILPLLPTLTTTYLGENKLVSLRDQTIAATYLDLERNRLENLGDFYILSQIPDIQYIFLKQNRFSYCVKPDNVTANSQLIYLDLGENMIELVWDRNLCLDVFWALSKLQVLHLNNNYLTTLPRDIFRGLTSLNRLNLASNLLSYLSPGVFPESLNNLNISGNQLLSPDPAVFMTLSILDITHNRYVCDCTLSNLLLWLNQANTTLAGSQDDIYCIHPPAFAGVPLSLLLFDGCNEDEILKPLQFAVFIFTSVVLVMFITAVIIFIHLRGTCFVWYKTIMRILVDDLRQAPDTSAYLYDAYLCYSRKDFEWIQNSLLKHLDSQYSDKNRFTLCFEERDFLPGEDHISNIRDAIWNSRKTICIVTRQFLKDGWCVEAFNFAQNRYFCDLKDVLIVVVVGSLSQYQLMKYKPVRIFMQRSQYMRWPEDHQDIGWFLNNLSRQILTEKKVKKKSNVMELQGIATIS